MRILVTGGAGFIGSHVVRQLLARGHEVAVLDNLRTGRREFVPAEAAFAEVDVCDAAAVGRFVRELQPQAICHQAAQTSVAASVRHPAEDARINVLGGLNVLQACVDAGLRGPVVFASTGGAIYGEVPPGQRADTDWPARPKSPYAAAKLAFEHYLAVYRDQHGLPFHSLRYANVYGPRQDPHGEAGVVAIFAHALLAQQPVKLFAQRTPGDGGCVRDYVYIDDVVRANVAALEGELAETTVNVASGHGTTTAELLRLMSEIAGVTVPVEACPVRPGDLETSVLQPCAALTRRQPPTPLEQGLRETLAWFGAPG